MRYQEFNLTEDELFELKMSPGNLTKMAANIDARVGMEFELIVPGVESEEEEEYDPEPDYEVDESFPIGPGWTRDVISFFRGGDMGNSTSYIQRAIDSLNENFWDWMDEQQEDWINSDEGQERALEIARDNVDPEEYEQDPEGAIRQYLDHNEERIRDELADEFRDDADSHFERYLDEEGINSMSDFANEYNLDWPYWTQPEYYGGGGGLVSIDAVADEFSDAIGRPVNASSSYHGGRREAGHYVVEPDGSLSGNGGTGLEFVSPVLTVPEMLADIDKVVEWARQSGSYTNSTTGLHMNVSVPDQQSLDYVKLAMFLGDEYILKQFGREGNSYCKSALKKIEYNAKTDPSRVEEMMRQFQGGLNQLASKLIHTGSTEKFVSINNRGDWIEFRSPGGDWLGKDLGLVKNTLLRAVVALDVATKPQEFKQEYYKKLYKTLSQGSSDDSIQYFAKYAAGELPASALKSFVRQIQQKRAAGKKGPVEEFDVPFVWKVVGSPDSPYQSQGTEVIATSERRALEAAVKKWNLNIYPKSVEEFTQGWRATPVRPATDETPSRDQEFTGTWEVVSRNTDEVVHTISGIGNAVADAERHAARWQQQTGFDDPVYVRPQMRPRDSDSSNRPGPAIYSIINNHDGEVLLPGQQGTWVYIQTIADNIRHRRGIPREDIRIIDMEQNRAYLLSGQPAYSGGRSSAGGEQSSDANYEIVDYSTAEAVPVFRFIANTDQDAQRKFMDWIRGAGYAENDNTWTRRYGFRPIASRPQASAIPARSGEPVPAGSVGQQTYRVTYTIMDDQGTSMHDTSVQARNADAAMAQVRQALQARGQTPEYISADPLISTSAPSTTQAPYNQRWRILDRDNQEVYSFMNTNAQSDANAAAMRWLTTMATPETRERGPFEVVHTITRQ